MVYQIETRFEKDSQFVSYLQEQLKEFNNQHSPAHKQIRAEGAVKPVQLIVIGEDSEWQGGITGSLFWNWLEIDKFWLSEKLRGQGLGSKLLAQAEQIGREWGASKVLLTTFEFQARPFYERHSYKVVGVIEDYPPGSNYYTLVKIL